MNRPEHNSLRKRVDGRYCVYCGERATTDEHFPPVAHGLGGFIFPACSECNTFAGTAYARDFQRRAALVKRKIGERYREVTLDMILARGEDQWLDTLRDEAARRRRLDWSAEVYHALDRRGALPPRSCCPSPNPWKIITLTSDAVGRWSRQPDAPNSAYPWGNQ